MYDIYIYIDMYLYTKLRGGGMLRGSLNIAQATCSPYRAKTMKMDPGQGEGVSSSPGFSFFLSKAV